MLSNEKASIAQATPDAAGRARFVLEGPKLGAPGPGELHVSFAGSADVTTAAYGEDVDRHVKVALRVPAAERRELAAAVPEDGIPLVVAVSTSLGPVMEGSVEARVADVVVGAAPVEHGSARLILTFATQGSEALVRLRYVPSSPWFEPLADPTVRVPIRGPSLLSKAPILLAGIAVLAFFFAGRFSAQKNKAEPAPPPNLGDLDVGRPRMDVLRTAGREGEGWSGRVTDAHDGHALPGIRVWVERGSFEGRALLASADTNADGRFTLPALGRDGATLNVEGRLHARLSQDLPPPGELAIAVAQRRRALLGRMVTWARRRGAPFDVKPEPTPGHVRRAAVADLEAQRWAEAVEHAAFVPHEVDAHAEAQVDRLAPEGAAAVGSDAPGPRRS